MSAADYLDFYLGEGINVLPIEAGAKNPKYAWKRFQDCKYTELQTLKAHSGNFFVVCGRISDNLKILDIETWEIYEKHFSDIDSFTVKTPHGDVHLYYRCKEEINRIPSVNGWSVEVQGNGHGCTSAGSIFEGKQYEVIKDLTIISQDLTKLAHERLVKLSDDRETDITQWKKKIDISKVIAQTVEAKSQNKGCWMGICPFHNDTNPSLAVYKDSFYCFGCEEKGDVITWVMKRDNIGFKEAIENLSKEFGLEVPEQKSRKKGAKWSKDIEIGDKKFEVQNIAGSILVNRFDVTEFIKPLKEGKIIDAKRKRISLAHKELNVDDPEWVELISAVREIDRKNKKSINKLNSIQANKSLDECPFIHVFYDELGIMRIIPNVEMISKYLIDKFNILAISEENQVEGLALWIRTGNDYRQLPKSDLFLVKEMQTVMEEYGLSQQVNPISWISHLEILRQGQSKTYCTTCKRHVSGSEWHFGYQ
jgi:hypothetical protein